MPEGPASILGGLPVIAEVSYTRGDGWMTNDDADVDALYWMKRDGTKGKPVPQAIWDRLDEERWQYWECDVIESVTDHLCHEQWLIKEQKRLIEEMRTMVCTCGESHRAFVSRPRAMERMLPLVG